MAKVDHPLSNAAAKARVGPSPICRGSVIRR